MSDSLCKLATGAGFTTRALYTDDEEAIFEGARPIILNGIPDFAARPDFSDRTILLRLPPISDERRMTEAELWRDFNENAGKILGAILNGVSAALRNRDSVKLARVPRLADAAIWMTAAEPGLGFPPGSILKAYEQVRTAAMQQSIDADPVADAIVRLLDQHESEWSGMARDLLAEIRALVTEQVARSKWFPADASRLSSALRRAATALRHAGIEVEQKRTNRGSLITLRKVMQESATTVTATTEIGS